MEDEKMSKITILLSDYLDNLGLHLINSDYFTNGEKIVTKKSHINLFSPKPELVFDEADADLPQPINRLSVCSADGVAYTKQMTKSEFEASLPQLISQPLTPLPLMQPSNQLLGNVIDRASELGLLVYAYKQDYVEAWKLVDVSAFMDLLNYNQTLDDPLDDPMRLLEIDKNEQGHLCFFDGLKREVFRHYGTDKLVGRSKQLYFDIEGQSGNILFKKVSFYQLIPVLHLLMKGYSRLFISNLLLRYSPEKEYGYSYTTLNYLCYETTPRCLVDGASGLQNLVNLVNRKNSSIYDQEFRLWDNQANRSSQHVLCTEEIGMILTEQHLYDDAREKKLFSDQVIDLAESMRCEVRQTDRFLHQKLRLDEAVVVGGSLESYIKLTLPHRAAYGKEDKLPIERVYDLIDKRDGNYLLRELPQDEFLTYLLIQLYND